MSFLYHFCCEHSRRDIGEYGELRPHFHPMLGHALVWMTTESSPERDAVGLTMFTIKCDRLAHRYEVLDAHDCEPFFEWCQRRDMDSNRVAELTMMEGLKPETWWVSEWPVRVRVCREVAT